MKKTGPIIMVVVLVLVVAFGIGQFFAYSGQNIQGAARNAANTAAENVLNTIANGTQVVVYIPPVPATSTPVESGSCWTNSIAAPFRPDAWRCSVGNSVQDPCFQIPGDTSVVLCGVNPAVPNATSLFVLKLTQPLPVPEPMPGTPPSDWAWLVKLADGTLCSPFTGTLPVAVGGVSANYGCAPKVSGAEGLLIFGDFNTSSSVWTAQVGGLSTPTSGLPSVTNATTMNVTEVWQ
jgi:hypothetical protein